MIAGTNNRAARTIQIAGKTLTVVAGLGNGRWGWIYLVQDSHGKKYALKKVQYGPDIGNFSADCHDQEAELNQKLGRLHGYEKAVYDAQDGLRYDNLLLEYFPGTNATYFLKPHVKTQYRDLPNGEGEDYEAFNSNYLTQPYGKFPSGLARNITVALRMIEALERVQKKNILNGDLKFDNIVVNETDSDITAEIIDFGRTPGVAHFPNQLKSEMDALLYMIENGDNYYINAGLLPPQLLEQFKAALGNNPTTSQIKTQLQHLLAQELARHPAAVPAPRTNVYLPRFAAQAPQVTTQEMQSYFAYGSNMDIQQMRERVGFEGGPRAGKLIGYKLAFNKYSVNRQCGCANLIYTGNAVDVIEGMVYQLTPAQVDHLNTFEGANSSNAQGYKQKPLTLADGTSAISYIANITQADPRLKPPKLDYMKILLQGRKNGFLSADYFNKLLVTPIFEGGSVRDRVNPSDFSPIGVAQVRPDSVASAPVNPTPVRQAPAPVAVTPNRHRDPQGYLEHCITHGLQNGALLVLEPGLAQLTPAMVAELKEPVYQQRHPKTILALNHYVQEYERTHRANNQRRHA